MKAGQRVLYSQVLASVTRTDNFFDALTEVDSGDNSYETFASKSTAAHNASFPPLKRKRTTDTACNRASNAKLPEKKSIPSPQYKRSVNPPTRSVPPGFAGTTSSGFNLDIKDIIVKICNMLQLSPLVVQFVSSYVVPIIEGLLSTLIAKFNPQNA